MLYELFIVTPEQEVQLITGAKVSVRHDGWHGGLDYAG